MAPILLKPLGHLLPGMVFGQGFQVPGLEENLNVTVLAQSGLVDCVEDGLPYAVERIRGEKVEEQLLPRRGVCPLGSQLDPPGSGIGAAVVIAGRVVLHKRARVVLVDSGEKDMIHPDFKIIVQEPATLLFFSVEVWKEET